MAIALDAVTSATTSSVGTTLTFAHTCTGSDLILFVGAVGNNTGSATDDITGATYNGVAMTLVNKTFVAADRYRYLFYLLAPATGANNVVITSSTSGGYKGGNAISYTGASQTGQPDSNATAETTGTTITPTTTVVASNCWLVSVAGVGGASPAAGAGATIRGTAQAVTFFDSAGTVATGSQGMTINTDDAGSRPIMAVIASFKPVAASGPTNLNQSNLLLMGV